MAEERLSELRDRLYILEKKIQPLEWDLSRNQINEFKRITLEKLKEEHSQVLEEVEKLKQEKE